VGGPAANWFDSMPNLLSRLKIQAASSVLRPLVGTLPSVLSEVHERHVVHLTDAACMNDR